MENLETLTSKISKFGTISSRSDTHTTSSLEETRISELSNCEITDLIETKVSRNEFLTRENILLEIHLHRIGKDDLKEERKSIRKSRPSSIMLKRRNTYFDMSLLKPPDAETSSFHDRSSEALVMKQKYYILKTEMKLKNDEIKNRAEQHESTLWDIHMELEELEERYKEVEKRKQKLRNEIEEIECRLEIISDTIKWKTTINERISENITQQEKEIEAYQKEYDYIKNMVSSYKPITIIDVIKQQKTLKMTQNQLKYFKRKTNLLDLKLGKFA
ncbi:centromere-associated protein E-like [Centruroides sculpturatus]|uniref:centromere-associated protein E-like n=1 Tax=Centruroides sculpturatus TaxID=218467 RepID=UPI000C6EA7B0|nr:centromere-associated protein E-like [Centruroides sculpturatus]